MRTTSGHIIDVFASKRWEMYKKLLCIDLIKYICLHPDISFECLMRTFTYLSANLYFNTKVDISFTC